MRKAEPAEVIDRAINETLVAHDHRSQARALSSVIFLARLAARRCAASQSRLRSASSIGTYSSIYVAGAIALDLGATARDFMPPEKRGDVDEMP